MEVFRIRVQATLFEIEKYISHLVKGLNIPCVVGRIGIWNFPSLVGKRVLGAPEPIQGTRTDTSDDSDSFDASELYFRHYYGLETIVTNTNSVHQQSFNTLSKIRNATQSEYIPFGSG